MNAIDWFAIPVIDLERARKFHCTMLGFESMPDMETPNGTCAIFPQIESGVAGSLNPFMGFKPTADSGVTIWLNAGDDFQQALDRVAAAGRQDPAGKDAHQRRIWFYGNDSGYRRQSHWLAFDALALQQLSIDGLRAAEIRPGEAISGHLRCCAPLLIALHA